MQNMIDIPDPARGLISDGLREITQALSKAGTDISGGLLGGEFGYGADYENSVFSMTQYNWDLECLCDQGYGDAQTCPFHGLPEYDSAPNFLHKPSGFAVEWYKYIGRGMDWNKSITRQEWRNILTECLDSLSA